MSVFWEPLDTALSAVLEGAVEPADALTRAEEEILGSLLESENP
jgi:maltose-binding protein MalE